MKKRVDIKSLKKTAKSATKAIPLAVAISILSAGSAFAAVDRIDVDTENGIISIDLDAVKDDATYREQMRAALQKAFVEQEPIYIHNEESNSWADFGTAASEGAMLGDMYGNTDYNPTIY